MTRPHKCRRIGSQPGATGFKPCGVPGRMLETVELRLDELEAIRLADLEGLYHEAAAERMGVSRATFGNLVASARHKVATALLGSKMLVIQGGNTMVLEQRKFTCVDCGNSFEVPHGTGRPAECPSCHGVHFHRAVEAEVGPHRRRNRGGRGGHGLCRRARRGAGWNGPAVATHVPTDTIIPTEENQP